MASLTGKVAVVTGASKGIGSAIARELAARGARVAVNYSGSKDAAEATVAQIVAAGGTAIAVQASVTDRKAVDALTARVAAEFGPIDILVNNAGIYEFAPIDVVAADHYQRLFNTNVFGLLEVTQSALAHFNPAGGSIINISSVAAHGIAAASVYSATKGAVNSITGSLAAELGPRKIRVNSLSPGMIETEGTHTAGFIGSDFHKSIEKETPLGRIGQPQDVSTVAAFLASEDSAWVNGQTIEVAGGHRV